MITRHLTSMLIRIENTFFEHLSTTLYSKGLKWMWRLICYASSCFLVSCASQVMPQGGDKDTNPPKITKTLPENFSTGFKSKKIVITFDEYIQLKDLNSQLIVSPPLSRTVETKIRQKTLEIETSDTLQPNTTYTLNFGNSIVDNNESNALENFQYVFSTGDVIDSLKISGKVENAWDKKTEKGILVMLYKMQDDSLPLKKRPDYFSKTNDKGEFTISNISPGKYKMFALKETNADYLYTASDESVAFQDTPVDAGSQNMLLRLFSEKPKLRVQKGYSEEPGKAIVIFNQPATDVQCRFLSDSLKCDVAFIEYSTKRDTIIFWYKNLNMDSLVLLFSNKKTLHDTVSIRLFTGEGKTFSRKKNTVSISPNFKNGEAFDLNKNIILQLNHPVTSFDFSKISLTEDSIPLTDVAISFLDTLKKTVSIRHQWKEKSTGRLFIPPGTFTDLFGYTNDSLITFLRVRQLTDYGTLTLKMKIGSRDIQYIVLLIDERESAYRSSVIRGDTTITYDFLDPKVYRLKMIEDLNQNKEWDTGDYFKKIQPERVLYYPEPITIRANWDVDVTWRTGVGN